MKRSACLVLDANIIILLFEHGLWTQIVEHCDLTIAETVVDEADFFVDSMGVERRIGLQPDSVAGRSSVVALSASEFAEGRAGFDQAQPAS